MDVAATLDCYLSIVGKWRWFATIKAFWTTLACSLAVECCLVFYYLATFTIDNVIIQRPLPTVAMTTTTTTAFAASFLFKNSSNNGSINVVVPAALDYYNYTYYYLNFVKPYSVNIQLQKKGSFANAIFRDLLTSAALIVLNALILHQLQLIRGRKQVLGGGAKDQETAAVRMARVAERKRTHMIIGLSLTTAALKIPTIGTYIHSIAFGSVIGVWKCYAFVTARLETLSYGVPFFFYYFYNMQFQKYTNKLALTPFFFLPGLKWVVKRTAKSGDGSSSANHGSTTENNQKTVASSAQ
jgi:hypothetical protein